MGISIKVGHQEYLRVRLLGWVHTLCFKVLLKITVVWLCHIYKPVFKNLNLELGIIISACNPSTLEKATGGSRIRGQTQLHSRFLGQLGPHEKLPTQNSKRWLNLVYLATKRHAVCGLVCFTSRNTKWSKDNALSLVICAQILACS